MKAPLVYEMFKSKTRFPLHAAIRLLREDVVFLFLIEFNSQVSPGASARGGGGGGLETAGLAEGCWERVSWSGGFWSLIGFETFATGVTSPLVISKHCWKAMRII